jgi:hypothetical protein
MALLRHFDYIPDQADSNVRFELRNQEPTEEGEARVALTLVDLESGEDDGNLTIQLSPPDIEGLIEALEQTLEELVPSDDDAEETEDEDEEQADEPEPEPPARRTRGSKKQPEEDEK